MVLQQEIVSLECVEIIKKSVEKYFSFLQKCFKKSKKFAKDGVFLIKDGVDFGFLWDSTKLDAGCPMLDTRCLA